MQLNLDNGWKKLLQNELDQPYFLQLTESISQSYQAGTVFPSISEIFTAFNLCPFTETKVVILGQDPYHQEKQAHGLSFSVPDGSKIPPSLRNIYQEISSDLAISPKTSGNLASWAEQGILLLNATLTVLPGQPGSHQGLGWEKFTDTVIKKISTEKTHVVFILWGKYAQAKIPLIDQQKHLILIAPHPSPFSAYTGFFGCRHFSKTNEYLKKHGLKQIDW